MSDLLALTGRLKALAEQARNESGSWWAYREMMEHFDIHPDHAALIEACSPDVIFALSQAVERQHVALTHVADEIKGQREHSSDPYWYSHATRVYWAQVEGVARDALATTSTEPAPHA